MSDYDEEETVYGSLPWEDLRDYVAEMKQYRYGFVKSVGKPELPPGWTVNVCGRRCSEMWLRYYTWFRHYERCMVLCSDYANHMTHTKLPIVRDQEWDVRLQWAHAQMLREIRNRKLNQVKPKDRNERSKQVRKAAGSPVARHGRSNGQRAHPDGGHTERSVAGSQDQS